MKRAHLFISAQVIFFSAASAWLAQAQKPVVPPSAKLPGAELPSVDKSKTPLVPQWPGEIVQLLQSRKYAEARAAVDRLEGGKPPEKAETRAFHDLVRALSLRLEAKPAESAALVRKRLAADPETPWTAKLRGELEVSELAAGKPQMAQQLARADVESLLAPVRKDSLAGVYRGFARQLLEPTEALTQPNYAAAAPFLIQAREVAESETLKNDLTYQLARLFLDQGNPGQAVAELDALIRIEKRPEIKNQAKFDLGLAQFRSGQHPLAKRTWTDIARSLESASATDKSATTLKNDCYYAVALASGLQFPWELEKKANIAETPQLPTPIGNITFLARAVAAGEKALKADPANPRAVRTAYAICSILGQKPAEAVQALQNFIGEKPFRAETDIARKDLAESKPKAQIALATALRQIEKYDDAQAAFREYSLKYPDGAASAQALQAVIDIEIDKANKLERDKNYAGFREAIARFVAANPLQPSVPRLIYRSGFSFVTEKKYAEAINAWKVLLTRFPESIEADEARYQTGLNQETQTGELASAIETYRSVRLDPWRGLAAGRIAVMEQKSLAVITPRVYRTHETAKLKISTRNIEKLSFSAYRIDPESYFRKKHVLGAVEQLDIGLVKPDAEWSADVPGQARYKPVDLEYDLKSLKMPGVWVVKVTDDKTFQATTMVIGSDLDAIVKTSRDQILVYSQNMSGSVAKPGARVLVSDGQKILMEDKTGADGVLLKDWPGPRGNQANHRLLVIDGDHVATTSAAQVPAVSARGLTARAMIITDRPAYRPGQKVELRGIVREVSQSRYSVTEGAQYTLEVADSRGRNLLSRLVKVSKFGTFSESLPLDQSASLGDYAVRLFQPGGSSFSGSFRVEDYQLPKVVLSIELGSSIVERGEKITGKIIARYAYGTPLAGRAVRVQLPDGQVLDLATDNAGTAAISVPTEELSENAQYSITAELPDEGMSTSAQFAIPGASFTASLKSTRSTYLVNESIPVSIHTDDALAKPTGQTLDLVLVRRSNEQGRVTEQEVSRQKVKTDEKTGDARALLRVEDKRGGTHVVRLAGSDKYGRPVSSELVLDISGEDDPNGLRLLAENSSWKLGTEAEALLFARNSGGPVLLCFEADRMLGYRIVQAKEGENRLKWMVAENQFPNMTLSATRMRDQKHDLARLDVKVERGLTVQIKPLATNVKPGDSLDVEITTTDQNGKPAAAELSLSLVDKALVRLFGKGGPDIQQFFYDQSRVGAFGSTSTNLFRYNPATIRVPESIVEESERLQAQVANNASRELARGRAQSFAGRGMIPAPAAAASPAPMMADAAPPGSPSLGVAMAPARVAPAASAPAKPGGMAGGGMGGMMGGFGGQPGSGGRRDQEAAKDKAGLAYARKSSSTESLDRRAAGEMAGKQLALVEEKMEAGQSVAEAPARERTIETAYWNPAILTDEAGRGKVTIKAPNALGEYEFDGRGVTAADTLVGQASAELAVRKPFFIELDLPGHLTEGDRLKPAARLHHSGVKGEVKVSLERYINGQTSRDVKTVKVEADGVTNVVFDEITIPATQEVRFVASATSGTTTDQESLSVPASPWGTPVLASDHGSSRDDQTVLVKLPEGRKYESLGMMVSLSPTLQRQVLEAALGAEIWPMPRDRWSCIIPPPWNTTADRAADLMATSAAVGYLRQIGGSTAVDQARLATRVRGLVAELVSRQNDDGGWPLTSQGPMKPANPQNNLASDPSTSARVLLALAMAKESGVAENADAINRASAYVQANGGQARPWNTVALAYVGKIGFEELNALSRNRDQLDSAELATIALAWMKLDRRTQADELIGTLLTRSRTLPPQPGKPLQRYWQAGVVGQELTTAWAAWALALVRPGADELSQAIGWLNARRLGPGWVPFETKGPAVAAMAAWYGRAEAVEDRYRMTIRVNDQVLEQITVDGAAGAAVRLWNIPAAMIKPGENRVTFDVEGRARFGYGVELSGFSRDYGPDQKPEGKRLVIAERKTLAADPELDGRSLPTGYNVGINPDQSDNLVSMLPEAQRAKRRIRIERRGQEISPNRGNLVVIEEPLPSGTRVVAGSITSSSGRLQRIEEETGLLRLYFDPNQLYNEVITYELVGVTSGNFRIRPARVYSLMDQAQVHASLESSLAVLPAGEKSTDPYKPTPDELFNRGQRHFEKGRLAEAAKALEELTAGYALQDPPARETARMLLDAHIAANEPRKIVQDFEVLKEKAADLVLPIDKIRIVGDSYAAIGEFERAWLVWRAVLEAGYLEETRLGQTLRQAGRPLEAAAYLLRVWQAYPGSASLQSDFFGLSRWLAQLAAESQNNPDLRRQLLDARITRSELITQAISLTQIFLSLSPDDPLGDEASLALLGDLSLLDAHEAVVKVAENAARIYPRSKFLDSFQFGEALARFNLGEFDKAIAIAQRVAESTYEEPGGVRRPSPNRGQAQYIMAQIFDARAQFEKALGQYQQVQGQFPDAAVAVKSIERKSLKMPEVTVVPTTPDTKSITAKFKVDYRNIDTLDLKVYPVDLMRLYLTKKNLDQIASVDLAGIKPLTETTVKLGDGRDFADKSHEVSLPIPGEGAYLVMIRGRELFASGIVLATPIELEVLEEAASGRVRISAREAGTGKPLPKLQVKYSGSIDGTFRDGLTDLRGVYVAEGLGGLATIVVRQSAGRFAFYRGKTPLGGVIVENFQMNAPAVNDPQNRPQQMPMEGQQLDQNLRGQNRANELKQIERLENRYNFENRSKGVQIQSVK